MAVLTSRFWSVCVPVSILLTSVFVVGCKPKAESALKDPETSRLVKMSEVALNQEDYELAIKMADSAAARMPNAVEPYFMRGLIYTRLMRWEKVEEAYARIIEIDPDYEGVWNNRGNNALRQQKFSLALKYFLKEAELHPAARPWNGAGRAYKELKQIDSAMAAFRRAIQVDSTFAPAYVSYAEVLEANGRLEEALGLAKRALRQEPDNMGVESQIGGLLLKLNRPDEAIPHLERVTKNLPWHSEAHYRLAQALQRAGRNAEGQKVLEKSQKLSKLQEDITRQQKMVGNQPDNPFAHATLATSFRMAGMYDEALSSYRIALTLDPGNPEFENNVASLYFLKKDTLAALMTYQKVVSKHPKLIQSWINMGVIYALSGDVNHARIAWENALKNDPGNEEAKKYLSHLPK